jgi:hypothetical protein
VVGGEVDRMSLIGTKAALQSWLILADPLCWLQEHM